MERRVSFVDERAGTELVMPVTPQGYDWVWAGDFTSVHIDQLGDVAYWAGKKANSAKLELLLPAHRYPFLVPGAAADPQHYLEPLRAWQEAAAVVRYIVSGTDINKPVYIQELKQEENDGTNDVVATVVLREYLAVDAAASAAAKARGGEPVTVTITYTVKNGDTLASIARRFYGDISLRWRLAAANGIKNANLISPGQVLMIPPLRWLPGEPEQPRSASTAAGSYVDSGRVCLRPHAEEAYFR